MTHNVINLQQAYHRGDLFNYHRVREVVVLESVCHRVVTLDELNNNDLWAACGHEFHQFVCFNKPVICRKDGDQKCAGDIVEELSLHKVVFY